MSGFARLLNASRQLEASFDNIIVGAVSYTTIENVSKYDTEWENTIANKLNDIMLLNSKSILLNATVHKGSVPVNNFVNSDESKIRLQETIHSHNCWSNAIKTKAISRVVYLAYKNNDTEKIRIFKDLLQKLADLDFVLHKLNEKETSKEKELINIGNQWKDTARLWSEKKKLEEEKKSNKTADTSNSFKLSLDKKIHKIEILKTIQSRLLGSSINYDWIKDPASLHKYLKMTRKPPLKPEDFA